MISLLRPCLNETHIDMANPFKAYFSFSKKERIGILSMLVLIVIAWFLPAFFSSGELDVEELTILQTDVDSFLVNQHIAEDRIETTPVTDESPIAYFYFDPNTLNRDGWQQLGLTDRTITTIDNYRTRGGKFYKPEDFKKIFGLKKEEYDRLYPYIRIERNKSESREHVSVSKEQKIVPVVEFLMLNVNTADSTGFRQLRGIGSVLSKRIVAYRQKLGGFYSVDQLTEVFGLPDSTFERIRPHLNCDASDVKRMNINLANVDMLKDHPYIKYRLAAAVIAYRDQHGSFNTLPDLKRVHLVSDEIYERMVPYLALE